MRDLFFRCRLPVLGWDDVRELVVRDVLGQWLWERVPVHVVGEFQSGS